MVSEREITVRRLALEVSVTTVQGAALEAMEETVASVEVSKLFAQLFFLFIFFFCATFLTIMKTMGEYDLRMR